MATRRWQARVWAVALVAAACAPASEQHATPQQGQPGMDATADRRGQAPVDGLAASGDAFATAPDAPAADVPMVITEPDPPRDAPSELAPDSPPPNPAARDVTFFAFGDPQYGGGPGDKNSFHIQALNAAPDLIWPAGAGLHSAGRQVGPPRGRDHRGRSDPERPGRPQPRRRVVHGAPRTSST